CSPHAPTLNHPSSPTRRSSDLTQVWHQAFPPMDAYHGMSCSPLLYKDRVILYQDHRSVFGSFVVAFDKLTGKQLWKTPRKEKVRSEEHTSELQSRSDLVCRLLL